MSKAFNKSNGILKKYKGNWNINLNTYKLKNKVIILKKLFIFIFFKKFILLYKKKNEKKNGNLIKKLLIKNK